jgi:hypothetical protein
MCLHQNYIDIVNASIHVDTAAMLQLDSLKRLPDNIFTIRFDSLHIDGIGIVDLLHKNRLAMPLQKHWQNVNTI